MNRRKLFLSTARAALATAFGSAVVGTAGAQTPIAGRDTLPIPQANPEAIHEMDAREAHAPPRSIRCAPPPARRTSSSS